MSQVSYGTITIVDTTDIARIYMVYAKSVSNTTPPSDELTWSESIASAPGEGDFIWQKTVVEKAITEEKTYSDPVCVTGSSGQGVEKIINYYCNYGQGQPEEDYNGWQLEIPEYDGNKPNYWTKVVVIYSDDTREDFQASGTIATFESEKAGILDSLEVALSPIQDLHGYDRPWVGGAGNNKFSGDYFSGDVSTHYLDFFGGHSATGAFKDNGISVKANTTYAVSISFPTTPDGNWGVYGAYTESTTAITFSANASGSTRTFTFTPTTDTKVVFWGYIGDTWAQHNVSTIDGIKVQVEQGSTATAWTPYSNICPISGWDEVETHKTGVNVWDEEWEVGNIDPTSGANTSSTTQIRSKNYIPVKPNTVIYLYSAVGGTFNYRFYKADKSYIRGTYYGANQTLTIPEEAYYMRFAMGGSYGTTYNNDISINYPSTDHDYHAHEGQTYQTTLPQTVYGGTLDVVSGVLTVDRAMVDLGTLNWRYINVSGSERFISGGIADTVKAPPSNSTPANAICSQYEVVGASYIPTNNSVIGVYTGSDIGVRDTRYTDATSFKQAMSGVQLCYELATPQTYQLTPTQIDSLLGRNNIWSDGAVEVEGHTISKKDIMIYKDNGLTDVANKSAEANTSAAEALEKANDGIISTTQLWYQTNGTSAPSVPTNHSQIDHGTVTYNNWRSVRPNNSVDSYKYYYYCYEYLHGDGTYTYSAEAILDTSNLSQYQIDQLQVRIKKIWSNSTGSYMASGIGTNEVNIDNSSTYGFNSKSTTTGVSFNYNAIPLTSLGTDGIKLYSPTLTNGVITGSRLDATLNTNGLFLNRGGIESGGLSSGNGYVYLSTLDKAGITINGHLPDTNDPKWRAIIGSKFGVDSEGNLYANNANISGKITANSGSNVYTIAETDEIIGDVYDKASETKIIKYAYSTTLSGDDLSLTNTELPYRGIYVGPVDETAFEDFNNYTWELNPVWASKYADQYLHSIEDGIAIYNSDLGSDTYAGLSATALTFFLANVEQMRVGYEASIDDYGVIASSLIALGSGAGIKFDNYGHTDEGARGRYVWEVRDNGHLSLKLF